MNAVIHAEVQGEVNRRTSGTKGTAWLLWFFLGGINAHLAYLYPKQRVWIIVGSIILFLCTFGLFGLMWLVNWIPLTGTGVYRNHRAHVQRDVEQEFATRAALYGVQS